MEKYKLAKLFNSGNDLSKQWYVYFSYRHPETGKYERFRRAISMRLRTSQERHMKAGTIIRALNIKLKTGWDPFESQHLSGTSLEDAIDLVVSVKQNHLRSITMQTYKSMGRTFKRWLKERRLLQTRVSEFSFHQAQQYLDHIKASLKVNNRTYNNYLGTMVTFFNFLLDREYIEFNPFKRCKKLPEDEAEIVTFTKRELEYIRTHLPEDNLALWTCAQLIFYCFIRPAEIMRLKPKDIDLERQVIRVHGHLSKNRSNAVIIIPDAMMESLTSLNLSQIPEDHFIFARQLLPSDKKAAPTRMAECWREWADHNAIKKNIYHLKHTGAGMALEAGMNVRDLQLQLRHNSLEMTQVYLDKFRRIPSDVMKRGFPTI